MLLPWARRLVAVSLIAEVILACMVLLPPIVYGLGCLSQSCFMAFAAVLVGALELFPVFVVGLMSAVVARRAPPLWLGVVGIAVQLAAAAYGLLIIKASPEWVLAWLLAVSLGLAVGTATLLSLLPGGVLSSRVRGVVVIGLLATMATLSWRVSGVTTAGRCPGADTPRVDTIIGTVDMVESFPTSSPLSQQDKIVFVRDDLGAECAIVMAGDYRPDIRLDARVMFTKLTRNSDGNFVPSEAPPPR